MGDIKNEQENIIESEGDADMLVIKKDCSANEVSYTPANTKNVLKAIKDFNKKHPKMMKDLAK